MADKVTMSEFEKRLSEGKYQNLTGALRGIGKMAGWSDKERAEARNKASAHFEKGGAAKKGPKAAPKKAAKPAKVKVAKEVKVAKRVTQARKKPEQLDLPMAPISMESAEEINKGVSGVQSVVDTAVKLKGLGLSDDAAKKLCKEATDTLLLAVSRIRQGFQSLPATAPVEASGGNGDSHVDTSVADAALAAAAEGAKRANAFPNIAAPQMAPKGPPVIPPMMGRQG